ncbi:MAG TPA: molybdenum cofactor biosynthesis protein MoaE, partial [Mycobacterium sp.]|nr:molybdenum cofactor biosynthesis protein MoaE [Mycobacterium sp.]
MTIVLRAELTEHTIELAEHETLVAHHAAGAVVGFAGVVRDHDGGRTVTRLEYSAHPSAEQTLADVAAEIAAGCQGVRAIAVSHRIGTLEIGDAALVAAVAAD